MRSSKFKDAQKAFILEQGGDGVPVVEICMWAGICWATDIFFGQPVTSC